MPAGGVFLINPTTGQEEFVPYSDLEKDTLDRFIKPIGGFVFPADMFMIKTLPKTPFYLDGLLPKHGKAMLYGPPKVGKSLVSLQLARCIASGEDFLDIKTVKGRVLYLQFELGEEILQSRLLSTKQSYEDVFVGTTFSLKLDSNVGQKEIRATLEAVEPNVLILDPLYKAINGDENESHDMLAVLNYIDTLIEAFDCSVFLIHHAGKEISRRGRGSSVLEDWVDSLIQLTKVNKNNESMRVRLKPIFLRHAPLPDEPIEANLCDNFEFERLGPAKTVKQQVKEIVWGWPLEEPVTTAELVSSGVGSTSAVYRALQQLEKEGKVAKVGWGKYVKASKPKEAKQ